MTELPSMHFFRDILRMRGGDLKVWHYFCYVAESGHFAPQIFLTDSSPRDDTNPWFNSGCRVLETWQPDEADALFLAGHNWKWVPETCAVPVMNLIQNMRHAEPNDPRNRYLRRRAFRISVSEEVSEALAATGQLNGPLVTIPLGVDVQPETERLGVATRPRPIDVLISGIKNPAFATELADALRLQGVRVQCVTKPLERSGFLKLFSSARVAVTLPTRAEGFFMVPLEAIAHGCIAVSPDVPGTRSHRSNTGVFTTDYRLETVLAATHQALALDDSEAATVLEAGMKVLRAHHLDAERRRFFAVLDDFREFCNGR